MGRAQTAAQKSRQGVSRSATTTASTVRRASKPPLRIDAEQDDEWTQQDVDQAFAAGWELFACIDETTLKVFYEVNPAIEVAGLARRGDALAIKALRMVFRSKARFSEVKRKRRKP